MSTAVKWSLTVTRRFSDWCKDEAERMARFFVDRTFDLRDEWQAKCPGEPLTGRLTWRHHPNPGSAAPSVIVMLEYDRDEITVGVEDDLTDPDRDTLRLEVEDDEQGRPCLRVVRGDGRVL
jgi:hypothetical protein